MPTRDELLVSIVLRVGVGLAAACSLIGAVVGTRFLWLAVAILIATPIVRVAILVVLFVRERDWLYTAVSAFVLGVLLVSLHG